MAKIMRQRELLETKRKNYKMSLLALSRIGRSLFKFISIIVVSCVHVSHLCYLKIVCNIGPGYHREEDGSRKLRWWYEGDARDDRFC